MHASSRFNVDEMCWGKVRDTGEACGIMCGPGTIADRIRRTDPDNSAS